MNQRFLRAYCAAACLAFCTAAPTVVRAQGTDIASEAAGRALFDEGRRLMTAGDFAAACVKFEEGQRIAPGVGMKFNLAECYEKTGRVASAWSAFRDVASMSKAQGQAERERVARERAAELEPRIPKLRLVVPEGSRVPNLELRRDGTPIGSAQWGLAIPVDPGKREIRVEAPGYEAQTLRIDVPEAKEQSLEIPLLVKKIEKVEPVKPVVAPPGADSDKGRHGSGTLRKVGLIGAGVGAVGLGVGSVFGIMASGKKSDAQPLCTPACNAEGYLLMKQAGGRADVATVSFIAGGVFLAAGLVLFFVAPQGGEKGGETSGVKAQAKAPPPFRVVPSAQGLGIQF